MLKKFDSDFDEVNRNKRMNILCLIGKIEAEYNVFFDLHPMTMQELEKNPIYYNQVVNKGIYYAVA